VESDSRLTHGSDSYNPRVCGVKSQRDAGKPAGYAEGIGTDAIVRVGALELAGPAAALRALADACEQ
jgi:hypothetical protein